jgi:peptidoglycan/xylan/chitin deacetylase (PgdA/CDA1 family)
MGAHRKILAAGLKAFHASRLQRVAPRFMTGVGVILTFHLVRPAQPGGFQPNGNLEITPDFLDVLLTAIRAAGDDIVSLDEAHRRLTAGDFRRRFVVLTFDDGYRNINEFARPVLDRHGAPFAVYVVSRFAEGTGDLWWIVLERAIAASDYVETTIAGTTFSFALTDDAARKKAFTEIYWALRALPDESEMRAIVHKMADTANVATDSLCRDFCMDWQEIAELAADPLVTIGSHTDTHLMLAKAPLDEARADIARSAAQMEAKLGFRPEHFCFPYGDCTSAGPRDFAIAKELGFRTAVTMRRGALYPVHREHMTALPRISVNGYYQTLNYIEPLLSGVPTALFNRFARLDIT